MNPHRQIIFLIRYIHNEMDPFLFFNPIIPFHTPNMVDLLHLEGLCIFLDGNKFNLIL